MPGAEMKSRVGVRARCPNLTQIKQCLLGTKVLLKDARFALPTPFPSIRLRGGHSTPSCWGKGSVLINLVCHGGNLVSKLG